MCRTEAWIKASWKKLLATFSKNELYDGSSKVTKDKSIASEHLKS